MARDDESVPDEEAEQPREDEEAEVEERPRKRKRRKKRRRGSVRSDDESGGFTIQGGWLDGLFAGPNMLILLVVTFFFGCFMFPVALFAAITAADSDARRNALMCLGLFGLLVAASCCMVVVSSGLKGQ
jgi:hypothetical protein